MKILVTGSSGMLGSVLVPHLKTRGHEVYEYPKDKLDITDFSEVQRTLSSIEKLDIVINCAAYTKVDQAESEPDRAYLVNGYGAENIAVICNKLHVPMLHISTDYVFDGEKNEPYKTWDPTAPQSVYGKSKLAGEIAIQRHLNDFYIVRTSWLYGPNGKNFVDTIINIAKKGEPLKVVSDQIGSPTSTLSLSKLIADLIVTRRFGVYHATDAGNTNWFEFACEITKDMNVKVQPISTKEMPRPAARPKYSVLDKSTLISAIGHQIPSWQESLKDYLELRTVKESAAFG